MTVKQLEKRVKELQKQVEIGRVKYKRMSNEGYIMTNKTSIDKMAESLFNSQEKHVDELNSLPGGQERRRDSIIELIICHNRQLVSMVALYEAISTAAIGSIYDKIIYITDRPSRKITDFITATLEEEEYKDAFSEQEEYDFSLNSNFLLFTGGVRLDDPDCSVVINKLISMVKATDEISVLNVVIDNIDSNTETDFSDRKSIMKLYENLSGVDTRVTLLHRGTNGMPKGGIEHFDYADIVKEVTKDPQNDRLILNTLQSNVSTYGDQVYDIGSRQIRDGHHAHYHRDNYITTIEPHYERGRDFSKETGKYGRGIVMNPKTGLYDLYYPDNRHESTHGGTFNTFNDAVLRKFELRLFDDEK